jgi:hypothetical protein
MWSYSPYGRWVEGQNPTYISFFKIQNLKLL